jgi:hypothetical protein
MTDLYVCCAASKVACAEILHRHRDLGEDLPSTLLISCNGVAGCFLVNDQAVLCGCASCMAALPPEVPRPPPLHMWCVHAAFTHACLRGHITCLLCGMPPAGWRQAWQASAQQSLRGTRAWGPRASGDTPSRHVLSLELSTIQQLSASSAPCAAAHVASVLP